MIIPLSLLDAWQREVRTELAIRRDTVEIRIDGGLIVGIVEIDDFAAWLHHPQVDEIFEYDDVSWMAIGPYGIGLAVRDRVPMWPLHDTVVHTLRREIKLPSRSGQA